jgi:hypothetical protein
VARHKSKAADRNADGGFFAGYDAKGDQLAAAVFFIP